MIVFSEKVNPTFTSSNLNVITVKGFTEIFYDVFELEINGNKFVVEKVSENNGIPIVSIPVTYGGVQQEVPFLLETGDMFKVFYNKDNQKKYKRIKSGRINDYNPTIELIESKIDEDLLPLEIVSAEEKVDIIRDVKASARDYIKNTSRQYIENQKTQISKFEEIKKAEIDNVGDELKISMLNEFNIITEDIKSKVLNEFDIITGSIKSGFIVDNNREIARASTDIKKQVGLEIKKSRDILQECRDTATTLRSDLLEEFKSIASSVGKNLSTKNATEFNKTTNIYRAQAASEIKRIGIVLSKFETVTDSIRLKLTEENSDELQRIGEILNRQVVVEAENSEEKILEIKKNSNRALSRLGNMHREISIISERISQQKKDIVKFYNDRIDVIQSERVGDKQEILKIIESSRRSILTEISKIETDVPNIVVTEGSKNIKTIDLKSIKREIESKVDTRFEREIRNLRRIIELSAGGGSVAMQFADGGVMNGNLVVVGTLSARKYLGVGDNSHPPPQTLAFDNDTTMLMISDGNSVSLSALSGDMSSPQILAFDDNTATLLISDGNSVSLSALSGSTYKETDPIFSAFQLSGGNIAGPLTIIGPLSSNDYLGVNSLSKEWQQNSHGFAVGEIIYGSENNWVKSIADDSGQSEMSGIVTAIKDDNTFTLSSDGYIKGLTGLSADSLYFLSDTVAGSMTSVKPTTIGFINKAVFWATSDSGGYIKHYIGDVITSINAETAAELLVLLGVHHHKVQTYTGDLQLVTTTHVDVVGSDYTVTPKLSNSRILYNLSLSISPQPQEVLNNNTGGVCHFKCWVDGVEITAFRKTTETFPGDNMVNVSFIYENTSLTEKDFKLTCREYSTTREMRLHTTNEWDGSLDDQPSGAVLTVTEYAP